MYLTKGASSVEGERKLFSLWVVHICFQRRRGDGHGECSNKDGREEGRIREGERQSFLFSLQ